MSVNISPTTESITPKEKNTTKPPKAVKPRVAAKPPKAVKPPTVAKPPAVRNYINNRDLMIQVKASKLKGVITNELAKMFLMLTKRYGKKGNYANYSYNEDMQSYALLMLCKTWAAFDENRSNNPFAFYTQCVKNSFTQYLNHERRVRDIKDKSLIEHGFNPSYNYILEHEEDFHEKREAMLNGSFDDYNRSVITTRYDGDSQPGEQSTESTGEVEVVVETAVLPEE